MQAASHADDQPACLQHYEWAGQAGRQVQARAQTVVLRPGARQATASWRMGSMARSPAPSQTSARPLDERAHAPGTPGLPGHCLSPCWRAMRWGPAAAAAPRSLRRLLLACCWLAGCYEAGVCALHHWCRGLADAGGGRHWSHAIPGQAVRQDPASCPCSSRTDETEEAVLTGQRQRLQVLCLDAGLACCCRQHAYVQDWSPLRRGQGSRCQAGSCAGQGKAARLPARPRCSGAPVGWSSPAAD